MADEAPAASVKTPRDEAETRIALVLDGGHCSIQDHPALTDLDCLVLMRQLRIRFPYQSTLLSDLDDAIRRELRKLPKETK